MPGFWTNAAWRWRRSTGNSVETEKARDAVRGLLATGRTLRPWDESSLGNGGIRNLVEQIVEGLRKAGLEMAGS